MSRRFLVGPLDVMANAGVEYRYKQVLPASNSMCEILADFVAI
jgi:hypothetical protein